MAKATNTIFDPEFIKAPDFSQWQAEFNRACADFGKYWSNGKTANLDVNWLIAYQRKNIEAITVANQRAFEGVQALAKRQAEIARDTAEELQKATKELTSAGTPEDKLVKQADVAKETFETAVANVSELAELVQKLHSEAFEVLKNRVIENFDEVKAAFETKPVAKKAA